MSQQNLFTQQVAEIQLTYRNNGNKNKITISSSSDAVAVLRSRWDEGLIGFVEEVKIILLNRANKVLGVVDMSKGGTSAAIVDTKLVFAAALKACSSYCIIAHNHPSGNVKPSQADIQITKKLKEAGNILDLPVLDHIIITEESYFSFADEGLL